ncbi:putative ABC transport system permease protein [Ekhidna lutea]|uniref:Putative ABC transport system permease protein n=2 Tax=Ekhidna lutea TaxID=447679 RepID=A0A239M9H5_EKHLU|nr:putative ABC transport system permease protein [Ekhidna lutea]
MDRILEWYCAEYYLEEVQGDLHEWYAQSQENQTSFRNLRYLINIVRYFSFERSKTFQNIIQHPQYLSMKSIIKITFRNLRKDKISAFIRFANLVFGIGVFMLALIYADYELNYDRFHTNADNIYRMGQDTGGDRAWAAGPFGLGPFIQENIPDVKRVARFIPERNTWISHEDKKFYEQNVFYADSSVFNMLSYEMIQGNPKTALKDPSSIVITESMAKKYFGNEDPMGKRMQLLVDGDDASIVTGVIKDVPDQSHLQFDFLRSIYSYGDEEYQRSWRNYFVYTYFETIDNPDFDRIENLIKEEFFTQYNVSEERKEKFKTVLTPIHRIHLFTDQEKDVADHGNVYTIYILLSIGTFVLIISCINFVNITIIKGLDRSKEVGLRKTVGASRGSLVTQFLSENLVLLVLAGLGSLLLLILIEPAVQNFTGKQVSLNFIANPIIALVLLGIILGLELLSGLYPAILLSKFRPAEILNSSEKTSSRFSKVGFTRKTLVILQFSLSLILIIGSVVVSNQMNYLRTKHLGFEKDQILLLKLNYSLRQKVETLGEMINEIPGVSNHTISSSVPGYRIMMEGVRNLGDPERRYSRILIVDENFLNTYNMDISSGENFTPTRNETEFIINESMAALSFPDRDPIGQQLVWNDTGRVVGVVKDFNFQSLHTSIEPLTMVKFPGDSYGYLSIQFNPESVEKVLSGIGDISDELYPNLPDMEVEFLDSRFEELYQSENKLQVIIGVFCLMTIFLTISGVFGVASYNAHKKSKEIAVRKVLGASYPEMLWQLLQGFLYLLLIAICIGLPGAFILSKWWLRDFAYQTDIPVAMFVISAVAMVLIVLLTSGYISSKTARTNPATILKDE